MISFLNENKINEKWSLQIISKLFITIPRYYYTFTQCLTNEYLNKVDGERKKKQKLDHFCCNKSSTSPLKSFSISIYSIRFVTTTEQHVIHQSIFISVLFNLKIIWLSDFEMLYTTKKKSNDECEREKNSIRHFHTVPVLHQFFDVIDFVTSKYWALFCKICKRIT